MVIFVNFTLDYDDMYHTSTFRRELLEISLGFDLTTTMFPSLGGCLYHVMW